MEVNVEELDRIIDVAMRAPLSTADGQTLKTAVHAPTRSRICVSRMGPRRDRVEYLLDIIGEPRVIDFKKEGLKQGPPADPKFEFDTARLRNVINLVAQKSGWANHKPGAGHALGIAAHRSFLTYVAVVAAVEVGPKGQVRIPRVDVAVDAGTIINPDRVKSQFEGAAVFGTSIAMMGEV